MSIETTALPAVNPTAEEAYWREAYRREPYYRRDFTYDDYGPAFRVGAKVPATKRL